MECGEVLGAVCGRRGMRPQRLALPFVSSASAILVTDCDSLVSPQGYEEEEDDAFDVELTKNAQGLGITIAGYVGDKNSGEKTC